MGTKRFVLVALNGQRLANPEDIRTLRAMDESLRVWGDQVLTSRAAVGLAVGAIRGAEVAFHDAGWSDIASKAPITEHTIFRVGSITKTMTAVAVMQLWERGLVDLDSPAEDHLGAYRLVPSEPGWGPVTIGHLMTHTSGIPDVLRVGHLFHPSWGPFEGRPPVLSVPVGQHLPALAEYYRDGLRIVAEPGSSFAYSNHGFATLGQIVEEVSAQPLDGYLREHVFEPLGMMDTTLTRKAQVEARLAKGHHLGSRGVEVIADREWIGAGGGGVYSSSRDMVRYVEALLGGGSNRHGSVLAPATVATMFDYGYQADPRLNSGIGLGFFRHDVAGHRVLSHDGILPGFNSSLLIAPDDDVGVVAFTNGSRGAMAWLPAESERLLHQLAGFDAAVPHPAVPQHPEVWHQLCGRYRLPRVADLRGRVAMGGGVEVYVGTGRLMIRLLTPIPSLYRGFPLTADDPDDPYMFAVDLSTLGIGAVRLAFTIEDERTTEIHTDLGGQPISLYRTDRSDILDGGTRAAEHMISRLGNMRRRSEHSRR